MRKFNALVFVLLVVILISCDRKSSDKPTESSLLNWEALSDKILERANLQPGERVIMLGKPGEFDPLVERLAKKISATGANYLGTLSTDSAYWPESWKTDSIKFYLAKPIEEQWRLLDLIDLGIMLPGATPADKPYATLQAALSQGMGRTIHFHWVGAFDFANQNIPVDSSISMVYQKAVLETNYEKLTGIQQEFEVAMNKDWVTVTTPKGTNLRFKIGDRPVTKQDGNASATRAAFARTLIDREVELPAGAIRVAPMETTVEGTIAFPDAMWNGQKVEGLVMKFTNGMVSEVKARVGQDAVEAELKSGGVTAHSFREFALGFNPLLEIPHNETWIPYYGYGAGVVRLSLGNNWELGGSVTSGDYARVNFFTDATVTIGDEVWVKDGKMLRYMVKIKY